jgi:hypothetical protein
MPELDCRDEVFRERGHEVLGSVVQGTQMAFPDPFDVEEVHLEGRLAFNATLDDVRNGSASRILLIKGEAGCGKTHLIRALRAHTHRLHRGVIAYVHMTSEHGDYRKYLLRQVIRSLSDPYQHAARQIEQLTALDLISDALAQSSGLEPGAAERLREADEQSLATLVSDYADVLSEVKDADGRVQYADVDLNTLRTFLYRQSGRKPIQRRVSSFLNGEPLSDSDWQKLAALPRECDRGPIHLLGQLSRITVAALKMPLVICVDQIEASDITGKNHDPFARAMGTACELIENVPRMMVLLSCLDSAYDAHAPHLITSYRHRIENEPSPVILTAARNADEIRQIVSRRLKGLYEGVGLQHVPPDSVYPMPENLPERLARQHLRSVLQQIHRYWNACRRAAMIVEWQQEDASHPGSFELENVDRLRLAWNEFRTNQEHKVAENEAAHVDLLGWALGQLPEELSDRPSILFDTPPAHGGTGPISFTLKRTGDEPLRRLVGLCEKDARGNGLYNQVTALESLCTSPAQRMVIVRSTRFPQKGKLADHLTALRRSGSLTQVIEETCWETMQAMREFVDSGCAGFPATIIREWRTSDMPLAGLPEIRGMIEGRSPESVSATSSLFPSPGTPREGHGGGLVIRSGEDKRVSPHATPPPPHPSPGVPGEGETRTADAVSKAARNRQWFGPEQPARDTPPAPAVAASHAEPSLLALPSVPTDAHRPTGPMVIGTSDGFLQSEVTLAPEILTRHTAIFGANGSGKTVLALNIVERLLERGVGVVLFDRKGDLATYAVEEAWSQNTGAPDETERRRALRERLDIAIYTPGSLVGRPLVLPLLPADLGKFDDEQRQEQCRQSAMILAHICGATHAKADMFAAVLSRAVELLCSADIPHTLDNLEHVLLTTPPELLALLPAHNAKHCEEVGRRLNERRVAHGRLFSDQGEKLDLHRMLLGSKPGRVPLNIICTQFLEGDSSLAWIAQFLAAAGNFIQRFPAAGGRLQALLMFDEADLYIPATSKPVTKPGMENLLRRARAAGVGIMLASQNVGDFDYKALDNITTVFAGKLTTKTALHFVMGVESDVQEIASHMCLVKPATVPRDQIERIAAAQR